MKQHYTHNATTGEIEIRDFTEAELLDAHRQQVEFAAIEEDRQKKETRTVQAIQRMRQADLKSLRGEIKSAGNAAALRDLMLQLLDIIEDMRTAQGLD